MEHSQKLITLKILGGLRGEGVAAGRGGGILLKDICHYHRLSEQEACEYYLTGLSVYHTQLCWFCQPVSNLHVCLVMFTD